jgi:DNA mismatch endonuclease (patch repair protein)
MTDTLSPIARSDRMRSVRQKDTDIEVIVRKALHHEGFRYTLQSRNLPGSPDFVMPGRRIVWFIHGCFWHGHSCRLGRLPKTRTDWWAQKMAKNRARDDAAVGACIEIGWRVVTVWQCALTAKGRLPADELRAALIKATLGTSDNIHIMGEPGGI